MITFFKKSLSLQILSFLALILALSSIILCVVILTRQDALLEKMNVQVNSQLSEADTASQSLFTGLENDATASLAAMGKQVTGNLLTETENALNRESKFINQVLEEQVEAHATAIADLVAGVGTKSLMKNDYTQISDLSRKGSGAKEVTFILFLDKNNNPLPSYINRLDDRLVNYLKEFEEQGEVGENRQVDEMKFIIEKAREDSAVYVVEQPVKFYEMVVGFVLVGVDKTLIMDKITVLNGRFDSLKNNNDRTTRKVLSGEADGVVGQIRASLAKVSQGNRDVLKQTEQILTNASAQVKKDTTYTVIAGGILSCLGILVLISFMLRYTVLRPIAGITEGLKDAAEGEGDLTKRLHSGRKDEIGSLASWFDSFVERLNSIIVQIGNNSETVTASSLDVLSASEGLQNESVTLSAKADSVATASDRMNGNMISVAAASEQAATNLGIVADTATDMKNAMDNVLEHCQGAIEISNTANAQVQTTARQVSELGDAAHGITKVTETISEISEQTNLLALNATIEAARAGEAGKGFAVVANEIKELANQTQQATQDIRSRIDGIRSSTDRSVAEVERITQVISQVDAIMSTINTSITEQAEKTSSLALNIEQAAEGIGEVNENVAQSSQVSAVIAKDMSEVSNIANEMRDKSNLLQNSSQSLTGLSSELRKMINVFKVTDDSSQEDASQADPVVRDIFPWTQAYTFGLEEIDDQHKKLVAMINELYRAMKLKKGTSLAGKILDELVEYTGYHFSYEEQLFDQYGYKETREHKQIHKKLVEQVVTFQQDFHSGRAGLSMELMDFLTDWLKEHILKTDRKYVDFFHVKKV